MGREAIMATISSMGRRGTLRALGLGLMLGLGGCGDDGGGGGSGTGTDGPTGGSGDSTGSTDGPDSTADETGTTSGESVPPEEVIRELVEARCQWLFTCCSGGELAFELGPFTSDAADCTERVLAVLESGNPEAPLDAGPSDLLLALTQSYARDRITLDAAAVTQCASHLAGAGCTPIPGSDEHCDPAESEPIADPCALTVLATGKQQVGEECEPLISAECVPGARCVDFGTSGVCAQLAAEGESCFADGDCQDPLVCDLAMTGTCVTGGALGDPCAFADPENPVPGTEVDRCARGLSCDPMMFSCVGGSCGPGAPCVDDSQCPVEHFCVADLCQAKQGGGGPCEQNEHCISDFCSQGTQTCSTPSGFEDGVPCVGSFQCISDWCDPMSLVCEQPNDPGEPCDSLQNAECKDGYCDSSVPANPVCAAYGDIGDPCMITSECDATQSLSCVDMQCAKLQNGDPCFNDLQCEDGLCFQSMCDTPLSLGEACGTVAMFKPCTEDAFCNIPLGETDGSCTQLSSTGQACADDMQCWGQCVEQWGTQMCDDTPAVGGAWCDGR